MNRSTFTNVLALEGVMIRLDVAKDSITEALLRLKCNFEDCEDEKATLDKIIEDLRATILYLDYKQQTLTQSDFER